jgi:2-oxoglutarate dehydrogenase dihydrolipoamide succinyltransferase (E2 component)
MPTPITMPQLGETVLEGTVIKWLKQVGDTVAVDEPLLEISTDKVDTEIPSSAAGVLTEILVQEGETVDVGTVLAQLDGEAGGGNAPDAATPTHAAATDGPGPAVVDNMASLSVAPPPPVPSRLPAGGSEPQLSPIVRKLVEEYGVDVSQITGTGAGGRISKKDVMAYVAQHGEASKVEAAMPPRLQAVPASGPREEMVPLSHIRKAIATHMHDSLQVSARAWTMVEVNMENVARTRERVKVAFNAAHGFGLTYMPFIARATTEALLEFAPVNAELRDDQLVMRRYVNLGIAVAYEDGLIVPVVKDADGLNLVGLAHSINDLAVRARSKQLKPDEVHGGTFTITNPGPFGSVMSLPIINQPESAILAFDAVEKRPVVIDDAIAIRHMVYLSMSWDHRVIDGAIASQFLSRIKEHLETWDFAEDLGT